MNNSIPNHVAIIMDGNGRWATRQGLKRSEGHYAGYKRLKKTAIYILDKGVKDPMHCNLMLERSPNSHITSFSDLFSQ